MDFDYDKTDSLIFDMDGTLWNATESYAAVWNIGLERYGVEARVTGREIAGFMGLTIGQIFDAGLFGPDAERVPRDEFLRTLDDIEDEVMPTQGGVLYDGVLEGLRALSATRRLLLVSNCSPHGLINFMHFTGTRDIFTDSVSYGQRHVPKSDNIRLMVERHGLRHPAYVGDTQNDCDQAHLAGVPFIFASYGFGTCTGYDAAISCFSDLVK